MNKKTRIRKSKFRKKKIGKRKTRKNTRRYKKTSIQKGGNEDKVTTAVNEVSQELENAYNKNPQKLEKDALETMEILNKSNGNLSMWDAARLGSKAVRNRKLIGTVVKNANTLENAINENPLSLVSAGLTAANNNPALTSNLANFAIKNNGALLANNPDLQKLATNPAMNNLLQSSIGAQLPSAPTKQTTNSNPPISTEEPSQNTSSPSNPDYAKCLNHYAIKYSQHCAANNP